MWVRPPRTDEDCADVRVRVEVGRECGSEGGGWWVCSVASKAEVVVLRGSCDEGFDGLDRVGRAGIDGGNAGDGGGGVAAAVVVGGGSVGMSGAVCFACFVRVCGGRDGCNRLYHQGA